MAETVVKLKPPSVNSNSWTLGRADWALRAIIGSQPEDNADTVEARGWPGDLLSWYTPPPRRELGDWDKAGQSCHQDYGNITLERSLNYPKLSETNPVLP